MVILETKGRRDDKDCTWQAPIVQLFGARIWPGRKTVNLSNHSLSCFLPLLLSGGGRGDKSCFDAAAVRGLAREDSKHCLCRTFKINPSATGLKPPLVSLSLLSLPLSPSLFLPLFSLSSLCNVSAAL